MQTATLRRPPSKSVNAAPLRLTTHDIARRMLNEPEVLAVEWDEGGEKYRPHYTYAPNVFRAHDILMPDEQSEMNLSREALIAVV